MRYRPEQQYLSHAAYTTFANVTLEYHTNKTVDGKRAVHTRAGGASPA